MGDFDPEDLEEAFRKYLGTIPARGDALPLPHVPVEFVRALPLSQRHQSWHLSDSEERGVGHIGGLAFRRWGEMTGSGPVEPLARRVQPPPAEAKWATETEACLLYTSPSPRD